MLPYESKEEKSSCGFYQLVDSGNPAPSICQCGAFQGDISITTTDRIKTPCYVDDWSIRHGFYANMGGFHFEPSDWKSFPIDAKQLHYLVTKGYVDYPRITSTHIRDKNKIDGMLRLITLVQAVWFVVNIIARAVQHLKITALELSTAATVLLAVAMSLCWMSKPADVESPDYIRSRTTMAEILQQGGDSASGLYYYTPLDFVSREEWSWTIIWAHIMNYYRRSPLAGSPEARPISRFEDTISPPIKGTDFAIYAAFTSVYFAIFILGWNFSFPTRTESILWQAASVTVLLSSLGITLTLQGWYTWAPWVKHRFRRTRSGEEGRNSSLRNTHADNSSGKTGRTWFRRLAASLRNNSVLRDPALHTPIKVVMLMWFFGAFYSASRIHIFVEDFMELRSLPANAYETVDWSSFWPHVWKVTVRDFKGEKPYNILISDPRLSSLTPSGLPSPRSAS